MNINPDKYVPEKRQLELMDLAESGAVGSAVRQAIREAAKAAENAALERAAILADRLGQSLHCVAQIRAMRHPE